MVTAGHPWRLTGPWYRWARPGVPSSGRVSRPALQKYDSSRLVEEFLKDPQKSLKFLDEDFVHKVVDLPSIGFFKGKARRLSNKGYEKTDIRKLYLDTHKRFYLVVCELHCEAAGFPSVSRAHVCQAGFVVRKWASRGVTKQASEEVAKILKELGTARHVTAVASATGGRMLKRVVGANRNWAHLAEGSLKTATAYAAEQITIKAEEFNVWKEKYQVRLQLQGWAPKQDRIGKWDEVVETPSEITEQVFPLYPLIPDPRLPKHSGARRTIWYGLVPTGSSDTDERGTARFDEKSLYEIRCFVRRHKQGCPKKIGKPDCHGEIVWSLPSESFQLAPQLDLVGTANRPVSIQLPDLAALEAQAAVTPPNQLAPFRMVSPPDSNFEVSADKDGNVTNHDLSSQICSFSIPLITIVATFLFKLFLPVVTLLFGLFFMLRLKFCIPPSIQLEADITAQLKNDIRLGLDASIEANASVDLGGNLQKEFGADLVGGLVGGFTSPPGKNIPARDPLGPIPLAQMNVDIAETADETNAPLLTAKLEYEAHVESEVVV